MVVDESARHVMHDRLDDVLGREVAATLMAHLPPVGWQDVARRSDVDHLAAATQRDLAVLGAELRREMAELGSDLRREMAELGSGLRQETAALGEKVAAQGEKLADLRVEVKSELKWQTWKLLGGVAVMMVAAIVAVAGAVP